MRIHVLALDDVFDIGLASVLDGVGTAADLAGPDGPRFDIRVVGVRQSVRTHRGLGVPVTMPAARPDVVVLPALGSKTPETLLAALERPDVVEAGALLRRWAAAGTLVAAACTATFVVASAGLLDGRRCTTTWWLAPLFRECFPRAELDDSQMIVRDKGVVTAGAALAHLDLALTLVRHRSPSLASLVARYLVIDQRPSQAAFIVPDQLAHDDPIVDRFERWARRRIADRFSLRLAARAVGASERTLSRRMQTVLGRSPLGYVQELRVERALHLLRTSSASVDDIATEVGYSDGVSLRALLRRKTGRGVRDLRMLRP